jgi:hypothetical protein
MRTRWAWLVAGWLGLVMASGCEEPPGGPPPAPPPPADAPAANCTTLRDAIPYGPAEQPGETIVVARCSLVRRYATVTRGDWNYSWYVFGFDVVNAERGAWPAKQVVFVAYDAWPTRESGIVLGKPVWPYMPGRYYGLALRTDEMPPLVVGQEDRSYLEPHGPRVPAAFDFGKPEDGALCGRILDAVPGQASGRGAPGGAPVVYEETPEGWVVEHRTAAGGAWTGTAWFVGREDFSVRPLP